MNTEFVHSQAKPTVSNSNALERLNLFLGTT